MKIFKTDKILTCIIFFLVVAAYANSCPDKFAMLGFPINNILVKLPTDLGSSEKPNSVSVVSAEKVFTSNVLTKYRNNLVSDEYQKNNPPINPKGKTPIEKWGSSYNSWYMSLENWEDIKEFRWGSYPFPVLWDKNPQENGNINVMFFGGGLAVAKQIKLKDFKDLQLRTIQWLTPSKQDVSSYIQALEKGNVIEKDFAIRMLIRKQEISTLPKICDYLNDKSLQKTSLLAIEKMGTKKDLPILIKTFYLPKAPTLDIVYTMCKIGGKRVDKELEDWLNDKDIPKQTKNKILNGILKAHYKPALGFLVPLLKNPVVKYRTKHVLDKLGYFPPIKGSIRKEIKLHNGVKAIVVILKQNFSLNEPVSTEIRVVNDSPQTIYLRRPFRFKLKYKSKGKIKEVPMTRYGKILFNNKLSAFAPREMNSLYVKPGSFFSEKIDLGKIFHCTEKDEYFFSCIINYKTLGAKEKEEEKLINFKSISFFIK